jgi:MYXO-CTERM domain-containing protein
VPSSEEPEIGVCVPNVLVPKLRTEALSPGLGCSTTPGAAALWLLALGLVTRRRRCGASRGAATASLTDWDERH